MLVQLGLHEEYAVRSSLGFVFLFFVFSSRRRLTRYIGDWSSDVCSSDLGGLGKSVNENGEFGSQTIYSALGGQKNLEFEISRSEERRVGKECRSRWSSYH